MRDQFNFDSKQKGIYKHLISPEGELWEFRRSAVFIALMVAMIAAGAAIFGFLAVLSFVESATSDVWLGSLFLLVAIFLEGLAYWAIYTHPILLTVDRAGRVGFGNRQLCAPGTVRAVRIISRKRQQSEQDVYLELDTGKLILLPPQYFGSYDIGQHGRTFAEEIATALAVKLKESD